MSSPVQFVAPTWCRTLKNFETLMGFKTHTLFIYSSSFPRWCSISLIMTYHWEMYQSLVVSNPLQGMSKKDTLHVIEHLRANEWASKFSDEFFSCLILVCLNSEEATSRIFDRDEPDLGYISVQNQLRDLIDAAPADDAPPAPQDSSADGKQVHVSALNQLLSLHKDWVLPVAKGSGLASANPSPGPGKKKAALQTFLSTSSLTVPDCSVPMMDKESYWFKNYVEDHVSNNFAHFDEITSASGKACLNTQNPSSVYDIKGKGTIVFENNDIQLNFQDVYYCPKAPKNYLSLDKIHRLSVEKTGRSGVVFGEGLLDATGKIQIAISPFMFDYKMTIPVKVKERKLKNDLTPQAAPPSVNEFNFSASPKPAPISAPPPAQSNYFCPDCVRGGSTIHYNPVPSKATEPLEIVYASLCGPYRIATYPAETYFLVFVDAYSMYTDIVPVKKKDVLRQVSNYMARAEIRRKVGKFVTEEGASWCTDQLHSFLYNEGIHHESPSAGIVSVARERFQLAYEKAHVMLLKAKMNEKFMLEAIQCYTYIQNKLPEDTEKRWDNSFLDFQKMATFGCAAVATDSETEVTGSRTVSSPLVVRAYSGIMVGYSEYSQDAYYIYFFKTNEIKLCTDVKFDKMSFPYDTSTSAVSKETAIKRG